MTKEQAMQQAKESVYNATALFETLSAEGRLRAPGRQVREELSEHVAEFVADNWVSFDTSPNESELADAVGDDEANRGGDEDPTLVPTGDGGGTDDADTGDGEGEGSGESTDGGS